jgi:hypothetical protein
MAKTKPRQRKLDGLPLMTEPMIQALTRLRAVEADGYPFADLSDFHHMTRYALRMRDWIIESHGLDGVRHRITGRGKTALKAYEVRTHRTDDLCPACGEKPRAVSKNGHKYPYCRDCHNAQGNARYHAGGRKYRKHSMCADCGEKPRYVSPNGTESAYCAECKNHRTMILKREYRAARRVLSKAA